MNCPPSPSPSAGSTHSAGSASMGIAAAGPSSQDNERHNIHFLRFNQDITSLAVAFNDGYKIFSLTSALEKLDPIFAAATGGNAVAVGMTNPSDASPISNPSSPARSKVLIVERLFSSSLLAIVTQDAPRKLKVCHFKKGSEICNYSYSNTILSVKLNRARLVVCLEEALYIHNIRDMKILHTIRDTPPNPRGLCSLSVNSDNCFLAYPGSSIAGEVQLFDAFNLQAKIMIPAHEASLAALAFNADGSRLATASEKGTVIRVFSVEDGARLIEFRRGVKRCATVYCMSFSQDSQFLAISTNTETIHIFKFPDLASLQQQQQQQQQAQEQAQNDDSSWSSYFAKAVTSTAAYLPTQVTDTLNQTRSYATVTVPNASLISGSAPNRVAIANLGRQLRLLLASSDGYLYIYNLPGGYNGEQECALVKQHRLDLDCSPDAVAAAVNSNNAGASPSFAPANPSSGSNPSPPPRRGGSASTTAAMAIRNADTEIKQDKVSSNAPAVLDVGDGNQDQGIEESPPPVVHRLEL